jgi:hypothetical protein
MDPAISATSALFVGGLFLLAAGHKLADFDRFQVTVRAYRLVADDMAGFLAGLAVLAEFVVAGMTLSIGASWQQAGLLGAIGLLALYAGIILLNIARGNVAIDCGCLGFTAKAPRLTPALALRNLLLVAIAALALLPVSTRPLTWLDFIAVAGSLASLALLYAGFDLAITLSNKESLS